MTIADIAKASGVSTATVSLILRNHDTQQFSPATRSRVIRAAEQLNYIPNRLIASLRAGATKTLALVMPFNEVETMDMVERRAAELGYTLLVLFTQRPDIDSERKAIRTALEYRVDGLIWQPSQTTRAYGNLVPQMQKVLKHIVFLERKLRQFPHADCVHSDVRAGIREGVELLKKRGYKRMVYVYPEMNQVQRRWRLQLFRRYCGGDCDVIPYTSATVREDVRERLEQLAPGGSLGIFCDLDWGAIAVVEACKALNLRMPEDAGIIGLGDFLFGGFFRMGELCQPTFSAIRRPSAVVAKKCVELLVERISSENAAPGQYYTVATTLIERETTAKRAAN